LVKSVLAHKVHYSKYHKNFLIMKSHIIIAVAFLLTAFNTQAQQTKSVAKKQQTQNKVAFTETDEKYANTTIVYTHGVAKDADVLNQMNTSFGMGDVVRIAVAPPKPSTPPVAKLAAKSGVANKPVIVSAPDLSRVTVKVSEMPAKQANIPAEPAFAVIEFPASQDTQNLTAGTDFDFMQNINVVPASNVSIEADKAALGGEEKVVSTTTTGAKTLKINSSSNSKSKVSKSKSGKKKSTPSKKGKRKNKQRYGCFKF
jgi:hypothetical protein